MTQTKPSAKRRKRRAPAAATTGAAPVHTGAETAIEIDHMHKWFGQFHVLKDINLKVMKG